MVSISSQSTRSSGRAQSYAKKGPVLLSAVGAPVQRFEQRLQEIRAAHGKDGYRPKVAVDEDGRPVLDENGNVKAATDAKGSTVYEAKYVQAYSLVQSFGPEELDPDDPESWVKAQELGQAIAEDRAPGHPVLVATEVSGRSGLVHNHLIIGATHPETGKQIDSNVFTHSRMAIAHDRVLEAHGFTQREDMREQTRRAEEEMERRREEVAASAGFDELSPSQQERRLTSAESSVRLERSEEKSAHQQRQERRQREYERYILNEETREAALDVGVEPPKERFSEIVLESRIRETLKDPRVQSWDDLVEVGRENRVVVGRRGKDITYGMMLAEPDGTIAEPARAHTRRGGVVGAKTQGLGDGYRLEDVAKAIEENVTLQREVDERSTKIAADQQRQFEQQQAEIARRTAEDKARLDAKLAELDEKYAAEAAPARSEQEAREAERAARDAAWEERFRGLDEHSTSETPAAEEQVVETPTPVEEPAPVATETPDEPQPPTKSEFDRILAEAERSDPTADMDLDHLGTRPRRAVEDEEDLQQAEAEAEEQAATEEAETPGRASRAAEEIGDEALNEQDASVNAVEQQKAQEATEGQDADGQSSDSDDGQGGTPEEPEQEIEPEAVPAALRSRLRDVRSTSSGMQQRLTGLAELEERWGGTLPTTDDERVEFERQVAEIGVGRRALDTTIGRMDPTFHDELTRRFEKSQHRQTTRDEDLPAARQKLERLEKRNLFEESSDRREAREDVAFYESRFERLDDELKRGVYEPSTPAAEAESAQRGDQIKKRVIARGEAIDQSPADAMKAERSEMREINQSAAARSRDRDQGLGM